jgi:hypothetical protein
MDSDQIISEETAARDAHRIARSWERMYAGLRHIVDTVMDRHYPPQKHARGDQPADPPLSRTA